MYWSQRGKRYSESFDTNIVSLPALVLELPKIGGRIPPKLQTPLTKYQYFWKKNSIVILWRFVPCKSYSRMHFQKKLTPHYVRYQNLRKPKFSIVIWRNHRISANRNTVITEHDIPLLNFLAVYSITCKLPSIICICFFFGYQLQLLSSLNWWQVVLFDFYFNNCRHFSNTSLQAGSRLWLSKVENCESQQTWSCAAHLLFPQKDWSDKAPFPIHSLCCVD